LQAWALERVHHNVAIISSSALQFQFKTETPSPIAMDRNSVA